MLVRVLVPVPVPVRAQARVRVRVRVQFSLGGLDRPRWRQGRAPALALVPSPGNSGSGNCSDEGEAQSIEQRPLSCAAVRAVTAQSRRYNGLFPRRRTRKAHHACMHLRFSEKNSTRQNSNILIHDQS